MFFFEPSISLTVRFSMRTASIILFILIGCSPELSGERSVEDDLGRILDVSPTIERIAPLAPSITELVFAAGAGSKVAGVSTVDDFPPSIDSLPKYNLIPMDFEAIVSLDLDLIIASEQVNTLKDADLFASVGLPVFFVVVNDLEDITRSIRNLGELLGTSMIASHRASELEDSLSLLQLRTADIKSKPDVLFLIEHTTLYAFGEGSYIHAMIDLAGGKSLTEDMSLRFPILTDEFVLTSKPEVIVGTFGDGFEISQLLEAHPTWDILPAVESGRVYNLNSDYYLGPGPRLVKGACVLAEILHPEMMSNP
ncbi:MAG: ABC transporter substrate-binding protein [Bacteroidetes bacterium]|nr:ABC transporter substrate-binding protein [Bacteroidota bacterium]